jgi:glyoxylase I family protein
MTNTIPTGAVHHVRLTVTNVERARQFYTTLLGFDLMVELPAAVVLSNGRMWLSLGPAPNPMCTPPGDRFEENRVGLDHLSFTVTTYSHLEQAVSILDQHEVRHGPITDLGPTMGIYSLRLRDPDNIQIELTAPYGVPV